MALMYTPEKSKALICPEFNLTSVDGKNYSLQDFSDFKAIVILFICNHCPYVQAIEDRIIHLAKTMNPKGVQFIGVCSNDPTEYEEDSLENLKKRWIEKEYEFPYLHDPKQTFAQDLGAVCTPDIFVYENKNSQFELFYRGRLDDSWKDENLVKNEDLKLALDDLLNKKELSHESIPSMGCSIKWL